MEKIEIDNNPIIAKKRFRVLAFLIDFFVFWIIGMILGMFFGTPLNEEVGFNLNGLPALTMFGFGFFLWPISEGVFGQTIGKRFLDLKVISESYDSIGMGQAFVRFFMGIIDYMFLIGLIVASNDKQNKRLGDIVAKTLVVKSKFKV